jgi:hypothetical protein
MTERSQKQLLVVIWYLFVKCEASKVKAGTPRARLMTGSIVAGAWHQTSRGNFSVPKPQLTSCVAHCSFQIVAESTSMTGEDVRLLC